MQAAPPVRPPILRVECVATCSAVNAHVQESKSSYQREQQLQREREAQFLDDLKRAILLDGGYVQRLGPEVSDEGRCACAYLSSVAALPGVMLRV